MPTIETGTRAIHGITMQRDSDGSYAVTMPDRWFCASPGNDAEGNLEGEVCLLLDHLWNAAGAAVHGPFDEKAQKEYRVCADCPEPLGRGCDRKCRNSSSGSDGVSLRDAGEKAAKPPMVPPSAQQEKME